MRPNHARRITGIAIALTLALTLTLSACSFNNGYVTTVTIDGGDRTLALGDPLTLTATVTNRAGATDRVTWASSDDTVATIDANGIVTTAAEGTTGITATSISDPSKNDTITLTVDPLATLRWTRQFGSAEDDRTNGIASDASGHVYVAGFTFGDLEGPSSGSFDAFLRAFDAGGALRWARQFGTTNVDVASSVATDGNGLVFVGGWTGGALETPIDGVLDGFLRAYDANGTLGWSRQFGTAGDELVYGVAADGNGNVYVTGHTTGDLNGTNAGGDDAFLRAYDTDGALRWTRQFGTSSSDTALAVATDTNGNAYVAGITDGDLDGPNVGSSDAFLRSYDAGGNVRWTRQFGTDTADEAHGVATDTNGNVYVAGTTTGDLDGTDGTSTGDEDAFLRAYDPAGNVRWTRQFGTSEYEFVAGVATDANGYVYVAGLTDGDLDGPSAGDRAAFIRGYDPDGIARWTRQFGTNGNDDATGVATDTNGNVHVSGTTTGDLEGPNTGSVDAFVRSYGR